MKNVALKQIIADCCNDITFSYNGKDSGVTAMVKNYVPTFQAWHGDDTKIYGNVDDVMKDRFYSGKSLEDLVHMIDINIV